MCSGYIYIVCVYPRHAPHNNDLSNHPLPPTHPPTVEHAKEGVEQLVIAETHQKNATPFRCIVVLILLIIMMLGILVWKHSDSSSDTSKK